MKEEDNILDNEELEQDDDEVILGQGDEPEEEEQEEESEEQELAAKKAKEQEQVKKTVEVDKRLLDKTRRENFSYMNKIKELEAQLSSEREEMAQLRYVNDISTKTAFDHYENAAKIQLDRARDMRESALESGDSKAIAETDVVLSKAVYEYERLKNLKAEQEVRYQNEQASEQARLRAMQENPYQQQYPERPNLTPENYNTAEQWVSENEWFKVDSPNYDYDRHMLANQICDHLDRWCYQNNQSHMIGSDQYFKSLNDYMGQYAPKPAPSSQMRSSAPQSRSMVAPAKSRGVPTTPTGAPQRNNGAPLTASERHLIKELGVTEADYRKHKAKSERSDYFKYQVAQGK